MGDVLKFPGQWHGPELGSEAPTQKSGINIEHLITMIAALGIYMPPKAHLQEVSKTHQELLRKFTDAEIVAKINSSDLPDWQTKTVFFHCLYREAFNRNLVDRNKLL